MPTGNFFDKRVVAGVVVGLISLGISWAIWATNASFAMRGRLGVHDSAIIQVNRGLDGIQEDLKEQRNIIDRNHQDVMDKLLEMQRDGRDR